MTLTVGETVSLSSLISATDPNGYALQGYILHNVAQAIDLNGAPNGYESPYWDYHGYYYIYAKDWNSLTYHALAPGVDVISAQVTDAHGTSAYVEEQVTILGVTPGNFAHAASLSSSW